jgi:NTE family protein
MTTALVLGAGGTVGMAYHAGVLRALEEVAGFVPDDADLVIGTSAGSMVGAAIRSGRTTEDLWLAALGEHPTLQVEQPGENPWARAWHTPTDALRRVLGSAYVLQRSLFRFPVPAIPQQMRRLFPGGFFTIADADDVLARFMPTEWPDRPLWLVTVDVGTGRRVILGRRNPPRTDLHTAVRASCAIPAFFQPQRVGRRTLVDGGVHSTSNLDLATKIGPDVIVGIVPMAFDPANPPRGAGMLVRRFAQSRLAREVSQARAKGARILLIRPSAADLDAMGSNMMRREGNDVVARIAYESAVRQLSTDRSRELLDLAAAGG